jgi:very-short-patch-repair endonuclease
MTDPKKTTLARRLRTSMTDAERVLWSNLRDRRLLGFKFRRQVPIAGFFADFACVTASLVIEADGGQQLEHANSDRQRTLALRKEGFRVLRFWNDDVLARTPDVLEAIRLALAGNASS